MALSDSNTGTIRTTWLTAFVAVITFIAARTGLVIDTNDPEFLVVAPLVVGVVYRMALVLSEKVPWIGYVFFGVNRSPEYTTPPPAIPALADEG